MNQDPQSQPDPFSADERARYATLLGENGWGEAAQLRLRDANIVVVGAGAVGAAAAGHIAAAGAGHVGVIDGAQVEQEDLSRATLHFTPDVTRNKAESLTAKLGVLNAGVHAEPFPAFVDERNVDVILEGADCVVDCCGHYDTSLLVNDACVRAARPLVVAIAHGGSGRLTAIRPGESACLRCSEFADPRGGSTPPLGPLGGAVGALAALEALKLVTGFGDPATGVALVLDGLHAAARTEARARRPDCICATG